MVDLKILEEKGCTPEKWKDLLQKRIRPDPVIMDSMGTDSKNKSDKLDRLVNRIRSRVQEARDYNLRNFRNYHTMDLLWDSSYRHVSPTLLASLSEKYDQGKVTDALKFFGYDPAKVFIEGQAKDSKTGETKKTLNYPAFFAITIPIVRSYLQARRAKIVNDRNLNPFIAYEPAYNNQEDRVRCEVLSAVVHTMAKQMGYLEVLNQAIFQMLLYSRAWLFPREEWYTESQLRYVTEVEKAVKEEKDLPLPSPDNEFPSTGIFTPPPPQEAKRTTEEYVTKQGVRFVIPHPSRVYWDKAFPAKSINPDCGVSYCGYWQVVRYREILANKGYWNTDHITYGSGGWWENATWFFNSVMNTTIMKFPAIPPVPEDQDREAFLASCVYGADLMDNSVFLAEHFEKLVPSEEGLGDYDHPVWCRFVLAGDDTLIYAAPIGYTPALCFEDNVDAKRLEDTSMGKQLEPFQDQLTNLTTQYLLSVKQNLANITLMDENIFKTSMLDKVRNFGESLFRELNIFAFDSKKLYKGQNSLGTAIYSHRFPYLDTNAIITAIRMTLDLAERVLQFSSQEIAQSASHEQTRAEVELLNNSTGNILAFTSIPVDYGMEAWASICYQSLMNWGEDDFIATIPTMHKVNAETLSALGFTVLSEPKMANETFKVKVKKTALMLLAFAYVPDPGRRITNLAAANSLANFMRDMMNNPIMGNAIGADQALQMANQIAVMAGIRMPRPLQNVGLSPEQQAMQSQDFLKQVVETVLKAAETKISPIGERLEALVKRLDLQDELPEARSEGNGNGANRGAGPMVTTG